MQNNCTKYNSESLEKASGAIGIRMTNDYLFRALMQRNNKVLKAFICSLLHLTMKSVCTVEIKNPIELGKHIIELATEEDRKYKIDYWANLFKSTTWEELKMIAKSDEYIQEAVDTVYQLSKEEQIRLQCEAREDYYRRMRRMEKLMEENKQLTAKYQQISTEHQQISAEYQ